MVDYDWGSVFPLDGEEGDDGPSGFTEGAEDCIWVAPDVNEKLNAFGRAYVAKVEIPWDNRDADPLDLEKRVFAMVPLPTYTEALRVLRENAVNKLELTLEKHRARSLERRLDELELRSKLWMAIGLLGAMLAVITLVS